MLVLLTNVKKADINRKMLSITMNKRSNRKATVITMESWLGSISKFQSQDGLMRHSGR